MSVPGNYFPSKSNTLGIQVGNRIGDDPDYFDERPIWGVRYENTPAAIFTTKKPSKA